MRMRSIVSILRHFASLEHSNDLPCVLFSFGSVRWFACHDMQFQLSNIICASAKLSCQTRTLYQRREKVTSYSHYAKRWNMIPSRYLVSTHLRFHIFMASDATRFPPHIFFSLRKICLIACLNYTFTSEFTITEEWSAEHEQWRHDDAAILIYEINENKD